MARFLLICLALACPSLALADPPDPRPNVVLITLDTTRADALSCDGQVPGLLEPRGQITPNLDALAEGGVRFQRAFAHAPTTLSSHTSLLTGLDPHEHQVPRNGFPLADGVPTLATRLQAEGYDTIAVVAASALAANMGLSAGFRLYDDDMTQRHGPMHQDVAEHVVARAIAALDRRARARPLFLWVHFYDPHGPYAAPPGWYGRLRRDGYQGPYVTRSSNANHLRRQLAAGTADPNDVDQFAARYLEEVAYMDHHVGALLDTLTREGLLDHALVVVSGDHGETLSDDTHSGWSHGRTVGPGVSRVPLLFRGYGLSIAAHAVVSSAVPLSGVAPTIEAALGLDVRLGERRDFASLVRPGPLRDTDGWPERPSRVIYSEATRPFAPYGPAWNNAGNDHGVRVGDLALFRSRRGDQVMGIAGAQPPAHSDGARSLLISLFERWMTGAPAFRTEDMDAETLDALRALGYIGDDGSSPGDGKPSDSP